MNQSTTSTSDTRICYRSSTSHLEVYVSVEELTKDGPLHLGHFPPSSDHKDQARVTYSIDGVIQTSQGQVPWVMPSRLGTRLDEERSAQRMGNQLTNNLSFPILECLLQILTKSHQPN
jgi:hypothetical protein